jgi:hypothetical protein
MHRLYLVLLSVAAVCNTTGQLRAQALDFSAHVGTAITSFAKDNSFGSSAFGLTAGGTVEYSFNNSFHALLHVDYNELKGFTDGATLETTQYTSVTKNKTTIRLAEASLLGAYRLPLSFLGDIAPFVTLGGSVGYNFNTTNNAITQYTYPNFQLQTEGKENVTSNYAQLLYSLQAGARFQIPLEDGVFDALIFDFRYRRNLNPVVRGISFSGKLDPTDSYANSLMASVGFQF